MVRSSASGLAIGVACPRHRRPERIRSAGSRSRTRSTGIIHEGRGLARGVRRIGRSGGVTRAVRVSCCAVGRRLKMVERQTIQQCNGSAGVGRLRDGDRARLRRGRALLGTTNLATLFAQLSFGRSRGLPGTTVLIAASSACQMAPHAQVRPTRRRCPRSLFAPGRSTYQRIGLARPAPRWRSHCPR